jgi:hypothetical protein
MPEIVEEILQEAKEWGLEYEVKVFAESHMSQDPSLSIEQAYIHAYLVLLLQYCNTDFGICVSTVSGWIN